MAFIRKKTLGGKYTPALLKKDLKSMSQAERRSFLEFFVEKRGSSVPARQRKNLHLLPLPMLFHLLDQSNRMTIEMGEVLYHAKEDMTTTAWQMPEEEKAEAESVTTEDATEQEAQEEVAEEKGESETEKQLAALAAQLKELERQLEVLREENQEQKKKNKEEKQDFRIRLDNEKRETETARKEQRRAEAMCEELKRDAEKEAESARDKIRELEERHRQSEREKKELLNRIEELKKYEDKYLGEIRKQPKILIFSRIDLREQVEGLNCDLCAKADALENLSWKEYAEIWNVSGTLRFADKVKIKQFSSLKITTISDVKKAIEERLRK